MLALLALILTAAALGPLCAECGAPRVVISGLGSVVGETVRYHREAYPALDTDVDIFRGIPYAETPARFAKPEPKQPWSGDLDATHFRSVCPQGITDTDEDCLFLNIWVPNPKPHNAAVMVFIHGGAFLVGAGSYKNGLALAAYHDVIVVTCNYRLGAFGFLSTGDCNLPGNYGMWDQVEALKWVKEYIADFGGDANRITIFGQSAGGASVGLLTLAKQSWGYYNRAIMQSGTATSPWAVLDPARAKSDAFKLGRKVDCFALSSSALASCLKTKSPSEILNAANRILTAAFWKKNNIIPFVPTIDGEFLTDDPTELYKRGEFKHGDALMGTVRDEGTLIAFKAFWWCPCVWSAQPTLSEEDFDAYLSSYVYIEHDQAMLDLIRDEYVDPSTTNYFWPFSSLTGDEAMICPTDAVAKAFAATGFNTYLYQMSHVSSYHSRPIVDHGDNLPYVFGAAFRKGLPPEISFTDEEIGMTVDTMQYWTNFAKTGNPNLESPNDDETTNSKTWHKFDSQTLYYKDLSPSMTNRQGLKQDECRLWNERLPGMVPGARVDVASAQQKTLTEAGQLMNIFELLLTGTF